MDIIENSLVTSSGFKLILVKKNKQNNFIISGEKMRFIEIVLLELNRFS